MRIGEATHNISCFVVDCSIEFKVVTRRKFLVDSINLIERRSSILTITVKNDAVYINVSNTNVSEEMKTLLVALAHDANRRDHATYSVTIEGFQSGRC